ncbi:MAG: CCA tRNA nucleotidyltransferase [Deltaproteobacteria bacterium]|nr:CCA tRNA nucleotidyltransferase [Deltaproteobacteria bacterium]
MKHKTSEELLHGAEQVLRKLEESGYKSMFVGGCVRDRLLGRKIHDYDIATTATPEIVSTLFSEKPFRVIPSGLKHGTVTVLFRQCPVEVTTLRIDVKGDGRHAVISYTDSFKEDASRRDFTVNALYQDQSGRICDFFCGQKDLNSKTLRFVGNPDQRIQEDYLRILRYFRLRSQLGFHGIKEEEEAITRHATGLCRISSERITEELSRMFAARISVHLLSDMDRSGITEQIGLLPKKTKMTAEKRPLLFEDLASVSDTMQPTEWTDARFALLLHTMIDYEGPEASHQFFRSFRLPSKTAAKLLRLSEAKHKIQDIQAALASRLRFIDFCEAAGGDDSFLRFYFPLLSVIFKRDVSETNILIRLRDAETADNNRRRIAMPVDGRMIQKWTGLETGQRIGHILSELKDRFREHQWTNSVEAKVIVEQLHITSTGRM